MLAVLHCGRSGDQNNGVEESSLGRFTNTSLSRSCVPSGALHCRMFCCQAGDAVICSWFITHP